MVKGGKRDRLFVIYSHHTIEHDGQRRPAPGGCSGRPVRDLLLRFPNVVLWVNGHTHRNTVIPYARPKHAKAPGGFWEVNTAAHVDWPQQARTVELVDNGDGTLSIFGTIIDHAAPDVLRQAPEEPAGAGRALPRAGRQRLAGAAKPRRPAEDGRRGALEDRNVELLVPAPFELP